MQWSSPCLVSCIGSFETQISWSYTLTSRNPCFWCRLLPRPARQHLSARGTGACCWYGLTPQPLCMCHRMSKAISSAVGKPDVTDSRRHVLSRTDNPRAVEQQAQAEAPQGRGRKKRGKLRQSNETANGSGTFQRRTSLAQSIAIRRTALHRLHGTWSSYTCCIRPCAEHMCMCWEMRTATRSINHPDGA